MSDADEIQYSPPDPKKGDESDINEAFDGFDDFDAFGTVDTFDALDSNASELAASGAFEDQFDPLIGSSLGDSAPLIESAEDSGESILADEDIGGAALPVAAAAMHKTGETAESDAPLLSVVKKRRGLPIRVAIGPLLGVMGLSVALAFLLGLSVNALPPGVMTWWPTAVIAVGALWALSALARRRPADWIGGSAVIGIGIAALLATAFNVPFAGTGVGVTLIAIGTGIVLRSILFPAPVLRV